MRPGWPRDLPDPGSAEFGDRVAGWLLDRGPADLRSSDLRHLPSALAHVVAHVVEGELTGLRAAYARVRVDLGEEYAAAEIARILAALEAEGARLLAVHREVLLVREALAEPARRGVDRGPIA